MRHQQQLPDEEEQITDQEASQFMWLPGPLARLIYEHFAQSFYHTDGVPMSQHPGCDEMAERRNIEKTDPHPDGG